MNPEPLYPTGNYIQNKDPFVHNINNQWDKPPINWGMVSSIHCINKNPPHMPCILRATWRPLKVVLAQQQRPHLKKLQRRLFLLRHSWVWTLKLFSVVALLSLWCWVDSFCLIHFPCRYYMILLLQSHRQQKELHSEFWGTQSVRTRASMSDVLVILARTCVAEHSYLWNICSECLERETFIHVLLSSWCTAVLTFLT